MSDLGWNIWGAIAGVAGTVLAIVPFLAIWISARLPTTKLPALLSLTEEAQKLYATALRERLFADEGDLNRLKNQMISTTVRVEEVAALVYATRTRKENVKNWWRGVTGRILSLHEEVVALRAKLATRNSKERKRRVSQGLPIDMSSLSVEEHDALSASSFIVSAPVICEEPEKMSSEEEDLGSCSTNLFSDHRDPATFASPRHNLSDTDLRHLLSLALSNSLVLDGGRTSPRASRTDLLLHLSRQLYGSGHPCVCGHGDRGAPTKRRAKRSRFTTLARSVRRTYGGGLLGGSRETSLDPESLLPLRTEYGCCNEEEWSDE